MKKQKSLPKLPRGEGSFFYHKNDTIGYRKNFSLQSGHKIKKTVYGKTISDCLQKMKEVEKDIENNTIISREILVNALYRWLEIVKKPEIKIQSYERMKQTINSQLKYSDIGNKPYQKITSEDIQLFINDLNEKEYAYSTIKKSYYILKAFYDYVSIRDNQRNPMQLVVMPKRINIIKEDKKVVWFEKDDIEKFITECKRKNKYNDNYKYKHGLMYAANIYLGLRIGELLALQWKDVDLINNTIYVHKTMVMRENSKYNPEKKDCPRYIYTLQNSNKTNQNRFVPVNSKAKELISSFKEVCTNTKDDDYIMITKNNTIVDIRSANSVVKTIQKNAKTQIQGASTHTLRHTCASLYFRKGVPIEIIAKILGHTPEVCRKVYIGLAEEQLKEAASQIVSMIEV